MIKSNIGQKELSILLSFNNFWIYAIIAISLTAVGVEAAGFIAAEDLYKLACVSLLPSALLRNILRSYYQFTEKSFKSVIILLMPVVCFVCLTVLKMWEIL